MKLKQLIALAAAATVTLSLIATPALRANAASSDAAASGTTMTKEELKAQKKAEKKARRAKKNAELSTLEKNGYSPAGNQSNYPENLQKAQQKAAGQQPSKAASAPQ
jgi:hypothetical protein